MTGLHFFEVTLTRKIKCPQYGPDAYTYSRKKVKFPYGKNQPYKNGKEALIHATMLADFSTMAATEVSIFKMYGGGGVQVYRKVNNNFFDKSF